MMKKAPVRQCVGCREQKLKKELVRIVRSSEGMVSVDFSGKANGRGAYLCKNPECLKRAVKSHAIERAFEVKISQELLDQLCQQLEKAYGR